MLEQLGEAIDNMEVAFDNYRVAVDNGRPEETHKMLKLAVVNEIGNVKHELEQIEHPEPLAHDVNQHHINDGSTQFPSNVSLPI